MKIKIILFILLSYLFSSCEKELETVGENRKQEEVKFSLSGDITTRAGATAFEDGDKIGIYIVRHLPDNSPVLQASGNFADNKCYTVTGGNLLPVSENDKIYTSAPGYRYSVYAYYPYSATVNNPTNIDFDAESDQRTMKNVKQSDFMLCQVLNTPLNTPVSLNFKRKLASLNLIYNKKAGESTPPEIAVYGHYSKCRINLQTGTLTEGQNEYSSVAPMCQYSENASEYHYCMVLPAYNFQVWKPVFQVEKQGNLSYYNVDIKDFKLQEGVRSTIRLQEKKCRITCTAKSDVGNGGTIVGNSEQLISQNSPCTVSANTTQGNYVFEGWYNDKNELLSTSPNYTFTVNGDLNLEARFYVEWELKITSNIDTNLLKPYLKSITGKGKFRNKEISRININLVPGSPYVFFAWYQNGSLVSYDWNTVREMTKDYTLEARFAKVVYDKVYTSQEFNFISNNNFEYTFNVPSVDVYFPPNTYVANFIYAYFDGELYDFAHYGTYPLKKVSIYRSNGIEYVSGSQTGGNATTGGSPTGETYNVRFGLKFKYILPGNVPIRGKVHYRTYGFIYNESLYK